VSKIGDAGLWAYVKASIRPLGARVTPASWRSRSTGIAVTPSAAPSIIDLHGLTTQQAFERAGAFIAQAYDAGLGSVVVVTGKSGAICREFPHWMENHPRARRCTPENGGGAYRVLLAKAPRKP
jgi:dsDNA-specific endonuclease/ATPase MutS2